MTTTSRKDSSPVRIAVAIAIIVIVIIAGYAAFATTQAGWIAAAMAAAFAAGRLSERMIG
ncbi:MAG: hypothetical protein Q4G67_04680 [Actinomycetia bacterium]|nr:hypothetical protein [Actinomycetes bacterium]